MAGGHVGRQSHGEGKGPHEHAQQLYGYQDEQHRPGYARGGHIPPVAENAVYPAPGDNNGQECDGGQRSGYIQVGRGGPPAGDQVEKGHQPQQVGGYDQREKRQDQRGPAPGVDRADMGYYNLVMHKIDNEFQEIAEAAGHRVFLSAVAAAAQQKSGRHQGAGQPQHEHMLGNGYVQPEQGRQLHQHIAVGDVMQDDRANILAMFFYSHTLFHLGGNRRRRPAAR